MSPVGNCAVYHVKTSPMASTNCFDSYQYDDHQVKSRKLVSNVSIAA